MMIGEIDLPKIALAVRQPWAWAIIHGGKDIENRTIDAVGKGGMVPARIAICASKGMTRDEYESAADFMQELGVTCPAPDKLLRGGIIGAVTVASILTESASPWFMLQRRGRGLLLADPEECSFVPCSGMLGYFRWERDGTRGPCEPKLWMTGAKRSARVSPDVVGVLHLKTPYTKGSIFAELCETFSGRWEPDRLFMIFTARLDESDTHEREPTITLAAILGSGDQWEQARRGLRALKRKYKFETFHGTDFKHQKGDFKGWSETKCWNLLMDLGRVIHDNMTETVTVSLSYATYKDSFLRQHPRKMRATSQYGFCFEAALWACSKRILDLGKHKHRLSVVIEDGHAKVEDTARIFKERKAEWAEVGVDFLKTHTILSKEEDEMLMLADATAYGSALQQREIRSGRLPHHRDRKGEDVPPNKIGWTVVEVTPHYFETVIRNFNEAREKKQEEWLKRKVLPASLPSEEQPS